MSWSKFWLIWNACAVPLGIEAHSSPWLIAASAFCAGGLLHMVVAEVWERR